MGGPTIDKNALRKDLFNCNDSFWNSNDKGNCQLFVLQCHSQEAEGVSWFQLGDSCNYVNTLPDLTSCVHQAFRIANYCTPTEEEIKNGGEQPKGPHIHMAGAKAYRALGVTSDTNNIYYLDENEDIVIVGNQNFHYYMDESYKIVRLSDGMELSPTGPELTAYFKKYNLPAVENFSVSDVMHYQLTRENEIKRIRELLNNGEDNAREIGRSFEQIIYAASRCFPAGKKNIDTSWNGEIAQSIVDEAGEKNKAELVKAIAYYAANEDRVELMEGAFADYIKLDKSAKKDMIDFVRTNAYSEFIESRLSTLELNYGFYYGDATYLSEQIKLLEKSVSATLIGSKKPLFTNVVFRDGVVEVTVDEVLTRIDNLKVHLCGVMATTEIVSFFRDNPSATSLPKNIIDGVMKIPSKVGVKDADNAAILIKKVITVTASTVGTKNAQENIDLAKRKMLWSPSHKAKIDRIPFDMDWLIDIDSLLQKAVESLEAGAVPEKNQAYVTVSSLRISACNTVLKPLEYVIQDEMSLHSTSSNNVWYENSLQFVETVRKAVTESKKLSEDMKETVFLRLDILSTQIHTNRVDQLIRLAGADANKKTIKGYDWKTKASEKLDEAEKIIKKEKVSNGYQMKEIERIRNIIN